MLVLIRGAGDLASGIALRLFHAGLSVVMTEIARPTTIRRTVAFSQAVAQGKTQVEDVTARLCRAEDVAEVLAAGEIPVLVDPEAAAISVLKPQVVVDAILAKKNLGTAITDAPVVIGVGPGFTAGVDCHAVVETQRGHYLGRVIWSGAAAPNSGVPGDIGGYTVERIIRAPAAGIFTPLRSIGDQVAAGDVVARVGETPVTCRVAGVLRGILPDGTPVYKGMKSGDVDPRCSIDHCYCASDKALAVGGGVLEALLHLTGALRPCG